MMGYRMYASISIWMVFATVLLCGTLSAQIAPRTIKLDSPAVVQWKARASSIQKTLEENNEENCRGAPAAGIVDAFDLVSDALSVALVDFCGRGAYTDSITAMRMDHGEPVLARFRDSRGKKVEVEFLDGASAMHTVGVKLVAEKKGIYSYFADNDSEGKPAQCGVKAYVWNGRHKTFDLNLLLSKTASTEYCRSLRGQ